MKNNVKIISNLKVVLAEKNMSLGELSAKTGISYSQLAKWNTNTIQMSLNNIALICHELGITDMNKIIKYVDFEKKTILTNLKVS